MKKLKKVWGFALHFGYVESSRPGVIFLHHCGNGFDTLKEALTDLAHYFLDDYIKDYCYKNPDLETFQSYILAQGGAVASGGPGQLTLLGSHANSEKWWAWEPVSKLLPHFEHFYENVEEPFENILPHYLDPNKIENPEFKQEVISYQTKPFNEWLLSTWETERSDKAWKCLAREKRAT